MIRIAKKEEFDEIYELYQNAKMEMNKNGNFQWSDGENPYPTKEIILNDIKNENLFVCLNGDEIIASMVIEDDTGQYDSLVKSTKEKSIILYRLVVKKEYQNKKIGKKMLHYATFIGYNRRCKYIKSDTYKNNKMMNSLFLSANFKKCGELIYEGLYGEYDYFEKELINEADVIVVGGGHAGIEAAHACAKIGHRTILITGNIKNIGDMPCNPSIGGTSKGVIVREVDALGGLMGKMADKSVLQMKMLNGSKGPAVRCLRAQADKELYPKNMQEYLLNMDNLIIIEGLCEDIIVKNKKIDAVILDDGTIYKTKMLILTTGTYLKSQILRGKNKKYEGPHGEKRSNHLSDRLKELGFDILRLKTGTPPRIDANTVEYDKLKVESGDDKKWSFSNDSEAEYDVLKQENCYLVYTNEKTHNIIRENLSKSAMYGGYVEGIGPRYCPSIEDKIVKFKDKERHILFLEPQSMVKGSTYYNALYLQGFSTSMPEDIQEEMVHSLVGLEKAKILEYAYAIEYDAINPLQIKPSLESKIIENLFTAGQINGTSGYEEAAGQGIIAGINASNKLLGKKELILKRNEAYIGVLIDDLVTKGTIEPYRMLTSRAEYRLILRHDNADIRLRKYGYEAGLISEEVYQKLKNKINNINEIIKNSKNEIVKKEIINNYFECDKSLSLYDFIKRSETDIDMILNVYNDKEYTYEELEEAIIEIKYEGYIQKTYKEVEKMLKLESKIIPIDIDYDKIKNLASEAKQKLKEIRPQTIAQATRISGVNPSDISILAVYLKKEYAKNE